MPCLVMMCGIALDGGDARHTSARQILHQVTHTAAHVHHMADAALVAF